jgi:hypothetical protein
MLSGIDCTNKKVKTKVEKTNKKVVSCRRNFNVNLKSKAKNRII